MAEYINKAKVEWFKCKGIAHFEGDEEREFILIDVKHINELPTIDIVTCKDCKYIDRTICLTSFPEKYGCKLGNGAHRLDFFCSDGEVE